MHKLTWRNCWSASVPATCVTAPINIIANNLFLVSMKAVLGNEVVRKAFGVFGRTALDIIKPSVPSHKCRHVRPSAYTLQSCGYGRNKVCASGSFYAFKTRRRRMWPCACCVQDSVLLENELSETESKSICKMRMSKRFFPLFIQSPFQLTPQKTLATSWDRKLTLLFPQNEVLLQWFQDAWCKVKLACSSVFLLLFSELQQY